MKSSIFLFAALAASAILPASVKEPVLPCERVEEGDEWVRIDYRRDIVPGSALDFSGLGLHDAPAGKYGWLVSRNGHAEFEQRPGVAARFYGVNLCSTANYLPSNEVEQVTDRILRLGYNAIRIHHHDTLWAESEENRDALDRLVAACVRKGIYLTTDIYVSRRIPWRDLGVDRDGEADGKKILLMTTDAGFDNWKRFARDFLMRRNRYTGRSLAEEPAMPFLVLINESSPHANANWQKVRELPAFQSLWDEWLAEQRAVNPSAWPLAKPGELPKNGGWWGPSPENDMKAAFWAWCVVRFSRKATAFLRNELGVKAMLATENNGPVLPSILKARAEGGNYTDFHFYTEHAGPAKKTDRKNTGLPLVSLFRNHNPLNDETRQYRRVAFNRIWGHPLVVSESQMGGPNFNRAMAGLVTGAYAAIQDWTGIWTFALAHGREKLFDGFAAPPGRFDLSLDPLMQATDRLPTLLFLRGDQPTPSAAFSNVLPDGTDASGSTPSLSACPEWIGRGLEWKSRLGVSFGSAPLPDGVKGIKAQPPEEPTGNPAPCGVVVDETKGRIVVSGKRTAGGFVDADDAFDAGTLRVGVRGHRALVAAAALDGSGLADASRILVWHLTDLHGKGFSWGGKGKKSGRVSTGILSWGNNQLLAHIGEADVSLALADAQLRKVYALGTDGRRECEVPAKAGDGNLSFTASVRQPFGGCMMYEIVKERAGQSMKPAVAQNIDVGRQLFVDDVLVDRLDGVVRRYHYPVKYAGNPVLKAETKFEIPEPPLNTVTLPKGGGMWWDAKANVFKLWYEVGWCGVIHYATSHDGITWERPALDPKTGSNKVSPPGRTVDSWSVVRDPHCTDPQALYKLYVQPGGRNTFGYASVSPDGIHWTPWQRTGKSGDRSTMFYNPFTREWVFSLRSAWRARTRTRNYYACRDFLKESKWNWVDMDVPSTNCVKWLETDELDKPDPMLKVRPQLYCFDAVAYESIMLGVFEIWRGPHNSKCVELGRPKITDLEFAYSRDGFHWDRPDRTAAIRSERWGSGKWDTGYVQPLSNICVIMGDKLRFYYGAFAGNEEKKWVRGTQRSSKRNGMYDNGAMGFAELRRDGFVSLHAEGEGTFVTKPLVFGGEWLFVNADCPKGELRVEARDEDGRAIAPYTFDNCRPVAADATKIAVQWKGAESLSALRGRKVQLAFRLRAGDLYSFWVSKWRTGESGGYLAGGGPGYPDIIDRRL